MNRNWITLATVVTSVIGFASTASAQTTAKDVPTSESGTNTLEAPTHAVELTLGTGYAQGFGNVGDGQAKLSDVGQAGGALQLGVGYRIIPQLTLGVYGAGSVFSRADQVDSSTNIYSAAAGVYSDWHFLPRLSAIDPWVSVGTGWRGYWTHADQGRDPGTTSMHGIDWARLRVGVDYRIDQAVAVSPVIGADLTTFFTESTPSSSSFSSISNPTVNAFLFAGLQGRFDIPTESSSSKVASR